MLDKIHSGMPDHTASSAAASMIINIYSVPTNFFLSKDQIEIAEAKQFDH